MQTNWHGSTGPKGEGLTNATSPLASSGEGAVSFNITHENFALELGTASPDPATLVRVFEGDQR
jgi:hypothetical protein